MVQAIDQRAIEGAMDDESDGSGSNGRSDGLCKRLFRDLKKEC